MAKRKPSSKDGKKSAPKGASNSKSDGNSTAENLLSHLLQSGAAPADIIRALEQMNSMMSPSEMKALKNGLLGAMREIDQGVADFYDDDFGDADDDFDASEFDHPLTPAEAAEECATIDKQLKRKPNDIDLLTARARFAATAEEAVDFQSRAFAIVTKKLGKLERYADRFWVDWKTRPYMTVRFELARYLWEAGQIDESIGHLRGLLELNPNDNQGVRYRLLKVLTDVSYWGEAEKLIEQYSDDDLADMRFTAVLLEFRRSGDSPQSRALLRRAIESNRHVVGELLGEQTDFDSSEDDDDNVFEPGMSLGSVSEAKDHATGFRATWRTVPGAISWLRAAAHQIGVELKAAEPKPKKAAAGRQVSASALRQQLRAVKRIPAEPDEAWIVDVVPNARPGRWGLLIIDADDMRMIFAHEFEAAPTVTTVASFVCEMMLNDEDGIGAFHPEELLLIREEHLESFQKWFEPLGINVEMAEQADSMRQMSDRAFSRGELPDTAMNDVPQYDDEWEVDWRRADTWVQADSGELVQPWVMMVIDRETQAIIQNAMELEEPTEEFVDRQMRRAVLLPQIGDAHRPRKVIVKSGDSRMTLAKWVQDAEVECEIAEFEVLDDFFDKMKEDLFPEGQPALVDTEGATSDLIGELYEVSARYFKAAPWRTMRPADIISIMCPQLSHITYYAAGMGQNGESMGFMLFDDPDIVQTMFAASPNDEDFGGLSLTLEDKHQMAPADIAAAEQFGWPVVSDESWPMLVKMSMQSGMTEVTVDEIRIMIVAAHAVIEFWKSPAEARRRGNTRLEFPIQLEGQTVVASAQLFRV